MSGSLPEIDGTYRSFAIKYGTDGSTAWFAPYRGPGNADNAQALALDSAGNLYVTGNSQNAAGNHDYLTLKYSPDGTALWTNRYNSPSGSDDYPTVIAADGRGNIYVSGQSGGYTTIKYTETEGISYRPPTNFIGTDSFAYVIRDSVGQLATGTVVVTVGPAFAPTKAQPDNFSAFRDTPFAVPPIALTSNDVVSLANGANTGLTLVEVFRRSERGGEVLIDAVPITVWTNRYSSPNADWTTAVALDSADGVIVTGYSFRSFADDAGYLTFKYRTNGTAVWTNRYDRSGNTEDEARAVAVDRVGNIYVTGSSATPRYGSSVGFATIRYRPDGTALWTNETAFQVSYLSLAVAVDANGDVCVAGGSTQFVTIKYRSNGSALWTNRFNNPSSRENRAIKVGTDDANNVYVLGVSAAGFPQPSDYVLIKYLPNGTALWTNLFRGTPSDESFSTAFRVDPNGNILVTGATGYGLVKDYATIKYSTDGAALWTNRYHGVLGDYSVPADVALDSGGNVYVTGRSGLTTGPVDFATLKYLADGTPVWTNRYRAAGTNPSAEARALAVDGGSNAYVTGISSSPSGALESVTLKYRSDGVPVWTNRYSNGVFTEPSAIVSDQNGNIYVTATDYGSGNPDCVTIRYSELQQIVYKPPTNFVGTDSFAYVIQDSIGSRATGVVTLAVNPVNRPVFTVQPVSQTATFGGTVLLSFGVSGPGPFRYQWLLSDRPIPGQTNTTLTIDQLNVSRAAKYAVVASDGFISVTSAPATILLFGFESYSNQTASLLLAGPPGTRVRVEYTGTLSNWQTLTNTTLFNNPQVVRDLGLFNQTRRFYRAALLP